MEQFAALKSKTAIKRFLFESTRSVLSLKNRRPVFSKVFFKSIGFFRRKFFFSLINNFRAKWINFFKFFSKKINKNIFILKNFIFWKFSFFFLKRKKFKFSKFFLGKKFNKFYYDFSRFFIKSKYFFLKKELKLLDRLLYFKLNFEKLFFFKNKEIFYEFFYFWKKCFFLGSIFFFKSSAEKKLVYYRYKVVIFSVLVMLLKNWIEEKCLSII